MGPSPRCQHGGPSPRQPRVRGGMRAHRVIVRQQTRPLAPSPCPADPPWLPPAAPPTAPPCSPQSRWMRTPRWQRPRDQTSGPQSARAPKRQSPRPRSPGPSDLRNLEFANSTRDSSWARASQALPLPSGEGCDDPPSCLTDGRKHRDFRLRAPRSATRVLEIRANCALCASLTSCGMVFPFPARALCRAGGG